MEIYDLSFKALISNLQDDCTVFFCPATSRFINTLRSDLGIADISGYVQYDHDTMCDGKVFNKCNVTRIPTLFIYEMEVYCDITLLFCENNKIQVVINRWKEYPGITDVDIEYDPYKLYYDYVGGITDLKSRMGFERKFLSNVVVLGDNDTTDNFRERVNEDIIKELFK